MSSDACAPSLSALTHAGRLLETARREAADLRQRVRSLTADTEWRARAADDYRAALAELSARVDRIDIALDLVAADVGAAERVALAGASCR